ncbi:very low-density lipoprotein receptor-like isoform X2 [Oscarella lobularis]|uniref:very low-density lipoprotein receptor-like isoform X2 n=1 Tax=Oscarella lobularis TaxID=121494 RepID=UPI0033133AED
MALFWKEAVFMVLTVTSSCAFLSDLSCSSSQFQCTNGNCVPSSYHCDDDNDCGDNSDERNCPACYNSFDCGNGKCVPQSYKCDDYDDCGNNRDEEDCVLFAGLSTSVIVGIAIGASSVFILIVTAIVVAVIRSRRNIATATTTSTSAAYAAGTTQIQTSQQQQNFMTPAPATVTQPYYPPQEPTNYPPPYGADANAYPRLASPDYSAEKAKEAGNI